MATILVVDDEPDIRSLLIEILTVEGHTVQTAANGLEALAEVQHRAFDLALVDVWLPGLNGLELLERLKDLAPEMPVIIITCRPACETAVLALRLGARDYVQKPFIQESLRAAVKRALTKDVLLPKEQRQWAAEQVACVRPWLAAIEQKWSSLTQREQQVLAGLVKGQTNAEIAKALEISVKTVGIHVSSVFGKLGVRSRAEAAGWAVRVGIGVVDRENTL